MKKEPYPNLSPEDRDFGGDLHPNFPEECLGKDRGWCESCSEKWCKHHPYQQPETQERPGRTWLRRLFCKIFGHIGENFYDYHNEEAEFFHCWTCDMIRRVK